MDYSDYLMSNVKKKLFFLALFSIIGFLSLQVPFNKIAGSNVSFTLFDFFGPMAGAFLIHPIGRQVPYYPLLFWWSPVAAYFKRNNLFLKSLGATFTAHAVGSTAFLYALNLPAEVWRNLPPIVASERLLFASGIAASYIVVKYTLAFLASKKLLPKLEIASS